jgi:hypothetical protein
MAADLDEEVQGLSAAQALTALNLFTTRLADSQGLSRSELEHALASDPGIERSVISSLESNPELTADLARRALSNVLSSGIGSLEDLADQSVSDAERAATLQGPLSLLIGGGIAIGLLFVLLLDSGGPNGVVMRQKMPVGLPEVFEKAGVLVEKLAKLVSAFKSAGDGKD